MSAALLNASVMPLLIKRHVRLRANPNTDLPQVSASGGYQTKDRGQHNAEEKCEHGSRKAIHVGYKSDDICQQDKKGNAQAGGDSSHPAPDRHTEDCLDKPAARFEFIMDRAEDAEQLDV